MFLSNLSIERPIFASIINIVLIVFGLFSYPKIGIDQNPNIDFPIAVVSAAYPGADTTLVEQKLLNLMEKKLSAIEGLDIMKGISAPNFAQVILLFDYNTSTEKAMQNVMNQVSLLQGDQNYPSGANTPKIQTVQIGSSPVAMLLISNKENTSYGDLSRLATDVIQPQLQQIHGVGNITIIGDRQKEIHVNLKKSALQSFSLSPTQIVGILQKQIIEIPGGHVESSKEVIQIKTTGVPLTAEQVKRISVPLPNGQTIRIGDVANVENTLATEETFGNLNSKPSMIMIVNKSSGGNIVSISEQLKDKVTLLNTNLGNNVSISVLKDGSKFIRNSMSTVTDDLILGAILAIIIVFVFLRDPKATLISSFALPTAVIGTFYVIYYMNFTINTMTMLALTLSIGLLIDDAIVVIENIHRHLAMGKSPKDAARDGTSEIGLAALAITLAIVAVFLPVAFMPGIVGRYFYPFGVTIASAVLVSLFVAFTLTPMMASRLLRDHHTEKPQFKIYIILEDFFEKLELYYRKSLVLVLEHKLKTIGIAIFIFIISLIMLVFVPKSFLAVDDQSEINITYQLPSQYPIALTKEKAAEMSNYIQTHYQGIINIVTAVAPDSQKTAFLSNLYVYLVPQDKRNFTVLELISKMRKDLDQKFNTDPNIQIQIGAPASVAGGRAEPIQLVMRGENYVKLQAWAIHMQKFIKTLPETADVYPDTPPSVNQVNIIPDAVRAADLGVTTQEIGNTINILFNRNGYKVGDYIESNGERDNVKVMIDPSEAQNTYDILSMYILNNRGVPIALSSVSSAKIIPSPSMILHNDGVRSITIFANYMGKDLSNIVNIIEKEAQKTITSGLTFSFDGQSKYMKQASSAMLGAVSLAIILVFMILCAQFESYLFPFTIMMSVPLAFSGAFGALLLTRSSMNLNAMIGLILLIGLVVKNGILIVDFTLTRMREGLDPESALKEAAPLRLRPILMTTFAMIFGMLPISLGHGAGGEGRAPMAIAVIGGLISSTLLTLIVVPCVLATLVETKKRFFGVKQNNLS